MSRFCEKHWPANKIERRALVNLKPSASNARTHSPEQVEQIAASIREWGWTIPVLVDEDGGVIAGHARLLAAKRLGIAEVPVVVASGWTEARHRAYALADNQLALAADWDLDLLRLEIAALGASDFDLDLTGFGAREVGKIALSIKCEVHSTHLSEMKFRIIVECRDEKHQNDLLEGFEQMRLQCRALTS